MNITVQIDAKTREYKLDGFYQKTCLSLRRSEHARMLTLEAVERDMRANRKAHEEDLRSIDNRQGTLS